MPLEFPFGVAETGTLVFSTGIITLSGAKTDAQTFANSTMTDGATTIVSVKQPATPAEAYWTATYTATGGLVTKGHVLESNGTLVDGAVDVYVSLKPALRDVIETVTTADVTAVADRHYRCDISGITTASKNFTLPVPDYIGQEIRVSISVGDPDYELIIKGAATVTLNGGTAATEYTRLSARGEFIHWRSTSLTNWDVEDDREFAMAMAQLSGDQSVTDSAYDKAEYDTEVFDTSGIFDSTNHRMILKKKGIWEISATTLFMSVPDGANCILRIYKNGVISNLIARGYSGGSGHFGMSGGTVIESTAATDYVEIWVYVADSTLPKISGFANSLFKIEYKGKAA